MMNRLARLSGIVSTYLLIVAVGLSSVVLVPSLFGVRRYRVDSESMRPAFRMGDVVYVRPVDPESLKAGDIITFRYGTEGMLVTHRVARVDAGRRQFRTAGDGNTGMDAQPVDFEDVIGEYTGFRIPGAWIGGGEAWE